MFWEEEKDLRKKLQSFDFLGYFWSYFGHFCHFCHFCHFLFLEWPINHKNVLFFAPLKQLTLALINMSALSVWYG